VAACRSEAVAEALDVGDHRPSCEPLIESAQLNERARRGCCPMDLQRALALASCQVRIVVRGVGDGQSRTLQGFLGAIDPLP
jgi:hypothetical protein